MKTAIIGAGNNARGHARVLSDMREVELVGIADIDGDRAAVLAAEVNTRAFQDYRVLLDAVRPDAVCISSPCWLHASHAVACLEAGSHVLCEKPMALTLEDCDRMITAASVSGVQLMVAQTTRFIAPVVELQRVLASGRCGDLVSAWSTRMSYHADQPGALWRLDGAKSGGVVFEWEIHEIDVVRGLGGPVESVFAKTACSRSGAPGFLDNFSAVISFVNGTYGHIEASQSCALAQSGRGFVGTLGAAQTVGNGVRVRTLDMETEEIIEVPVTDAKHGQDTAFVHAILDGTPTPVPGEDARANVEIGLAIVESGALAEVVHLPLDNAACTREEGRP